MDSIYVIVKQNPAFLNWTVVWMLGHSLTNLRDNEAEVGYSIMRFALGMMSLKYSRDLQL